MLKYMKAALGAATQSRTAVAVVAATFLVGGTATEASAKSRHHRHHHHHARAAATTDNGSLNSNSWNNSWRNANASTGSQSGGRTFSGVASYYGNESGSRTASGQRFNQHAMTAAHRSLPFGTKLRVTHGGRSVVVTVNDRGPFIRGRVLDLSKGAASAIGLTSRGVGKVVAEVM